MKPGRPCESVVIGEDIKVTAKSIKNQVKSGIIAPVGVAIDREEFPKKD